jgi:hypothetical protein
MITEVCGGMMFGGGGGQSAPLPLHPPRITLEVAPDIQSSVTFVHVDSDRGLIHMGIQVSHVAYGHSHKLTEKMFNCA